MCLCGCVCPCIMFYLGKSFKWFTLCVSMWTVLEKRCLLCSSVIGLFVECLDCSDLTRTPLYRLQEWMLFNGILFKREMSKFIFYWRQGRWEIFVYQYHKYYIHPCFCFFTEVESNWHWIILICRSKKIYFI